MKHLTKLLLLLLAILLPANAIALDIEVNGIYYYTYETNAVVTYKSDSIGNNISDYNGNVTIPSTVTYEGTTYTVTEIGYRAFYGCSGVTSITIPNTINAIDWGAFYGCGGLKSVNITDLDAWFNIDMPNYDANPLYYAHHLYLNGVEVKDLVIPNTVNTISQLLFDGCSGLTNLDLHDSVTSIEMGAFYGCSNLASITFGQSLKSIGQEAFYYYSSALVRDIFWDAVNCSSIVSNAFGVSRAIFHFGNSVEHIPAGLPSLAMSGKTLVLPNSVKTIDSGTFKGSCAAVVIGNGIENIASGAFSSGISVAYATSAEPLPCESGAFANPQTLYVPSGSKMKYFTSEGWSEFANIIEGEYVCASSITLNKSTAVMPKGSTQQLTATILPSNASASTVTWLSTNPAVATVSSNGKITAVAVGEADIVAMVDNVRAICHVTVTPVLVESLTLSDTQLSLAPDDMYTLTATVLPSNADNPALEWIIPDNDVILTQVVNNTRLNIGAVGSGSVTITVRTTDGSNLSATCTVNVQVNAASISLNKTSVILSEGYTTQLKATVMPENANNTVSWTTSNSSVATVDNNGLVTAIASGTAIITATTTDGTNLSASCEVTVISATDFTFHIEDIEGFTGSTISIPIELDNDYGVKAFMFDFYYPEGFRVTDYSITDRMNTDASISGMNHAEENFYRLSAICVSTNTVLGIGSGPIISFKVHIPEDAIGDYEISLKNIQIVPEGGKILYPSDISANLTVRNVPATAIQLDQSSAMLYKGESLQLTATVSPDEASYKPVNWSSSDEVITTVDENGLVTALAVGKATITATTIDGSNLSASCEVTVKENMSNYDNYLSLNDVESFQGDTIVIPVAMTNTESIISFQTDIFLPEGLEIALEDGDYLIDPSDRVTRTHSIVCNDIASGAVRVMCYSSNYKPFTGNSGDDLFYITVKVAEDARGDYNILLRNTLFTNSDFDEIAAPDVMANVTVNGYKLGDANGSGTITVTDVVVTSQYVLEQNPDPFIFWAADVNADGNITVTDVSRIAWMVLNPSLGAPRHAPVQWNNGDRMSGEGITIAAGETRTVSIALDNDMDYSAFQLDVALPEGLTAGNFRLTDRAGSHAFDVNTLANGKTRALCYSPTLKAISGNEGAVLTFDVTATTAIDDVINVDGIELVTVDCQTVRLDAFAIGVNSATALNEVAAGKTIAKIEYFNVAGQRLDQPESGVTLVVTTYTDGTRSTTKILK